MLRRRIRASITERGQVTIPAEIRKMLGIHKGSVEFLLEDGIVTIRRPEVTLEDAFGAFKPANVPEDWEARIREAKADKASEEIAKMARR